MLKVKTDFSGFILKCPLAKIVYETLLLCAVQKQMKEVFIFFLNSILRENQWYEFFSTFSSASSEEALPFIT